MTEWSVKSADYGAFSSAIFDEWVRCDVGRTFVQMFDVTLGSFAGMGAGLCVFGETCGTALAIEHNGDVYSCDHYVYPEYRLGNVRDTPLAELVGSPQQTKFGEDKRDTKPRYCRECDVRFACNGECPKHRFIRAPQEIMALVAQKERAEAQAMQAQAWKTAGCNDACPCGSGQKYKECCWAKEGRR